jgi:serine/threonine-protein kinase
VLDFGVAKAIQAQTETDPGVLKGKFSYMAPEVIQGAQATRRSDVFSAATVIWELLVGQKLFSGASEQERLLKIVKGDYPRPRDVGADVPHALESIVMKGLSHDPAERYREALDMAIDLERHAELASQRVVGEWVARLARGTLEHRSELIHAMEISSVGRSSVAPPSRVPRPAAGSAPPQRSAAETSGILERDSARVRAFRPFWLIGAGLAVALALVIVLFAARSRDTVLPAGSSSVVSSPAPTPSAPATVRVAPAPAATGAEPEPAVAEASPVAASSAPHSSVPPVKAPSVSVKPKSKKKPKEFLPDDL